MVAACLLTGHPVVVTRLMAVRQTAAMMEVAVTAQNILNALYGVMRAGALRKRDQERGR